MEAINLDLVDKLVAVVQMLLDKMDLLLDQMVKEMVELVEMVRLLQ